jgi:hypothetical protein
LPEQADQPVHQHRFAGSEFFDPNGFDPNAITVSDVGGALYIGPGCPEVTLSECSFHGNETLGNGGAIRLQSNAEMVKCAFSANRAGQNGGAIEAFYRPDPNVPSVLTVNLESCTFGGNEATEGFYGQGGALHFEDVNAVLTDCYLLGNKAKSGGGLFQTNCTLKLNGGAVSDNIALGGSGIGGPLNLAAATLGALHRGNFTRQDVGAGLDVGGGIVLAGVNAKIENCTFSGNEAKGAKGAGGAIAFYGGYVDHVVSNCLFTDNSAKRDGGAVWAGLYAKPVLSHSTFVKNTAKRLGGAVFCDWSASVNVSDSIFFGNSQYAIAEEDFAGSDIEYGLFKGNTPADYGLYDSVTKKTTEKTGAELSPTNLVADPLFVEGPLGSFYLSQKEAGQEATSPAVDAGNGPVGDTALADRTTRTDGVTDTGVVDLGYHFPDHTKLPQCTLTAEVIGGHGTIEPTSGTFYTGTAVGIKAHPESGWRIAEWLGTTDDGSSLKNNYVIMWTDRHVTVRFGSPRPSWWAAGPHDDQHAIDAAKEGDIVLRPAARMSRPRIRWSSYQLHPDSNKNIT